MRLINPTKEQLNAAFAEKVAGWHKDHTRNDGRFLAADLWKLLPRFTYSMDAVLPYFRGRHPVIIGSAIDGTWQVRLGDSVCIGADIPTACVIALLRANGVEVEYTNVSEVSPKR